MDELKKSLSRRQAVGLVGMGFATAASGSALAQAQDAQGSSAQGNDGGPTVAKDDPRSKYPKPPFQEQTQPWPGLAGKMDPKPDHGEKSYRGSGRLAGRKALITGGDSGMGRAAAIAYAREGADVAINYLPAEEPDAREVIQLIKDAGRRGFPIPGDLRDRAFCRRLVAEAVQNLGGLDIVVCNAGRQQSKASILDISDEDFDATIKTNIYAPFYIIKAALPHLSEGSCIIGTTSEQAYDPSPDLYDYAQTKAATMNYVKSLAKQLGGPGAFASTASRPGRSGRRCRSAVAHHPKNTSISAAPPRSGAPANLRSSLPSTSNWRRAMQASPPAIFTALAEVRASRSRTDTSPPAHQLSLRLRNSSTSASALRGAARVRLPLKVLWMMPERQASNTAGLM